ncbi:MAG TPA: threonine--tRNA ligase [Candidatus Paceibacterota bacterium]|nr:threonine--tRNA ligase [Candidatus Paceibacterota bacterium]
MATEHSPEKIDHIRHSLAHLLAAAVLKEFPDAKLGVGPAVENGFYYDFLLPRPVTPDDLKVLEKTMRSFVNKKLAFTGREVTPAEAKKLFAHQPFKLDLINDFAADGKTLTVYETGAPETSSQKPVTVFMDLCRGGHVENTSEIPADAFTLDKIAGAYWKGDEKNQQLQRIYGLAFGSKAALKEYEKMMEEAKKRDHRKLGKELQLFAIIDEIGPGLPLFYPKGTILRRTLENYITELQERRGYVPIWIPHITKGELYKISGHLDKYDAMYPPMELKDEANYYLKPMNCPHFMMLYKTLPHSYRELPVRYVCTTTNYRYEKSGELSGLTRVRALTQDDCHVFARPDQIKQEINLMLDMVAEIYRTFGFDDFWVRISTHDPANKEKYIGNQNVWADSEAALTDLIKDRGWKYDIGVGEAAFYGPKLDFIFKDVIGRDWQLSTIQLDMNLPQRFELEYIDESSSKQRPVVIHRAILGSTERFLGILIEHFAGKFPVWLSPVQVAVLPVSEKFSDYGKKVFDELAAAGIRAELAAANESLGKRIREAELMKVPYVLVVGEKEEGGGSVNVRDRKGEEREMPLKEFLKHISAEIKEKAL